MPPAARYSWGKRLANTVTGGVIVAAAHTGVALASYGPPPPPTAPVPGGYYCIATSQTVGPAGKLIGGLRLHGLRARLTIRPGTFRTPVQLTITEPYSHRGPCQGGPGVGNGGYCGYRAVGGVGIFVQQDGSAWPGHFRKPLILRLSSPSISWYSMVVVWNGRQFVRAAHYVARRGRARIRVTANADLAVLSPASTPNNSVGSPRVSAAILMPGSGAEFLSALFLLPGARSLPGPGVASIAAQPASCTGRGVSGS